MDEPKTAPEEKKSAPMTEAECCKTNDRHTFVIALLTSIIVVGLYHFGMGAYKIFFPECEASYYCEEVDGEAVASEECEEVRPPKEHIKGKKPGKPHFDKDGKPRKFGKDGKPRKFDKDGKPMRRPKGKKPVQTPAQADKPAEGKPAEKTAEKPEEKPAA